MKMIIKLNIKEIEHVNKLLEEYFKAFKLLTTITTQYFQHL